MKILESINLPLSVIHFNLTQRRSRAKTEKGTWFKSSVSHNSCSCYSEDPVCVADCGPCMFVERCAGQQVCGGQ